MLGLLAIFSHFIHPSVPDYFILGFIHLFPLKMNPIAPSSKNIAKQWTYGVTLKPGNQFKCTRSWYSGMKLSQSITNDNSSLDSKLIEIGPFLQHTSKTELTRLFPSQVSSWSPLCSLTWRITCSSPKRSPSAPSWSCLNFRTGKSNILHHILCKKHRSIA